VGEGRKGRQQLERGKKEIESTQLGGRGITSPLELGRGQARPPE
jgi:hypothetical protein